VRDPEWIQRSNTWAPRTPGYALRGIKWFTFSLHPPPFLSFGRFPPLQPRPVPHRPRSFSVPALRQCLTFLSLLVSFLLFSRMRIIGAYLLAVLGGNETPDKAAITKILSAVGASAEDDQIEKVLSELKGKDLDALIAEGSKKISSVPAGGAAAPAAGGAAAAPAAKAEAKKKSSSEESAGGDMGFSLFD